MSGTRLLVRSALVTAIASGSLWSHVAPAQNAPAAAVAAIAADNGIEEIVVTGIRASLGRALDMKRDASTIVDSISAEELGKFPSRNVADALINIPGITVERTAGGEGQRITIRGLGGDFNITTLNGRILTTEDSGREFAFDVLPSEMIAGTDVYKAVQAERIEGSLGGIVDLRSARPFDFTGLHMAGSVEGEYGDLPKKWGQKISGVISNTFDDGRMGALLTVSYAKRDTRTDNLHEISSTSATEQDWNTDFNGNGSIDADGKQYIFPQFYSVGTILSQHKRLGMSGTFQFKPSDAMLLTLDGMYTHYDASQQNYAVSNHVTPREGQDAPTMADPDALKWVPGTVHADANGVITNFTINNLTAEVLDDTNARVVATKMFGANLHWDATDRLHLTGDTYLSESARNSGAQDRFVVAGILGATGVFATRANGLPDLQITLPGGRSMDQATNNDYRAHYIGIYGDNLKDKIYSGKLDAKLDMDAGTLKALKFGVNYSDRRKSSLQIDNNATACNFCGYPFTFGDIGADVIRPMPVTNLLRDLPGNFPRNFASFDIDTYLNALVRAENNPNVLNPNDCPLPSPAPCNPYPTGYATQIYAPDLPLSFDVKEKTSVAFVQAELSGEHWRGDIGVRLVHTKVTSDGYSVNLQHIVKLPGGQGDYDITLTDPVPDSGGGTYTKALPALNFAYDLRHDLRLRLAASKVVSRPSLSQLTTAVDWSSWASGTFATFHAGNPNLKPAEANQFDASLEWYISPRSYLAAALFYKSIKNFVTTVPVEKVYTQDNGDGTTTTAPYTEVFVVNGDSGKVRGAEIGGQYLFDNGFGVVANFSATSSTSVLDGVEGHLEGVIPRSYNLKLLYEKYGWSNQLSYSYTSSFTHDLNSPYISGLPVVSDAYKELSATVSHALGEHFTVYLEGTNLLNNADFRFSTYRNVPAYYEAWGRAYFVGVRARL
jgi:iron complex outermembrane recepter protein